MNKKNLWILTEERPSMEAINILLREVCYLKKISIYVTSLSVIPILDIDGKFTFEYKLIGWYSPSLEDIKIKLVRGTTSFVDYLVYITNPNEEPEPDEEPVIALEETKTNPNESRNVNIYQRLIKFVYLQQYYNNTKMLMFYNFPKECFRKNRRKDTNTYNFGMRLLKTLGVKVIERINDKIIEPEREGFANIKDIISEKNKFLAKNKKDVPIKLMYDETRNEIQISIKLDKGGIKDKGKPTNDPNKGLLGTLIYIFREVFNYKGKIIVASHGINADRYNIDRSKDKIINLLKKYNVILEGIYMPRNYDFPQQYWNYDYETEKNVSIFASIAIEKFSKGNIIFENHAGSQRGYLIINGDCIVISKGVKIPDLSVLDYDNKQIIHFEAEKYENRRRGLNQLFEIKRSFGSFLKESLSNLFMNEEFNCYYKLLLYAMDVDKTDIVSLFVQDDVYKLYTSLILNRLSNTKKCEIFLNNNPDSEAKIINEAVNNLISYWNPSKISQSDI